MKFRWIIALIFVLAAVPTLVWAEDSINLQQFRPSIFGGDFIAMDDADTLEAVSFGISLYYDYANSLFSYYEKEDDTEPLFDFISELHTGHAGLSFGLWSWLSIGGHVPLHYMRYRELSGVDITTADQQFTTTAAVDDYQESDVVLGDIMAKAKLRALRQDKHWIGVALIPYVIFPTGDDELFVGEGRTTGGGTLALEHDFGIFDICLNGGYLYRQDPNELLGVEIGDAATFGAGIAKTWDSGFGIGLEYWGRVYDVDDADRLKTSPRELTGTLRYQFGKRGPRLVGGGGPGVNGGIGAPNYRLLGGVDYYYRRPEKHPRRPHGPPRSTRTASRWPPASRSPAPERFTRRPIPTACGRRPLTKVNTRSTPRRTAIRRDRATRSFRGTARSRSTSS
ncbi:MAG: hypothetical protein M5R36_03345 [Deltaproteobacteria bacterium]|nr:hypothetical protein [Deltaproteobacteria bacterium]